MPLIDNPKSIIKAPILLAMLFAITFSLHFINQPGRMLDYLVAESLYQFSLSMYFEADDEVEVSTFLPSNNRRQNILNETSIAKNMQSDSVNDGNGRYTSWYGNKFASRINYSALLSLHDTRYELSPNLLIPSDSLPENAEFLKETEHIVIKHPEIISLWNRIKPEDDENAYQVLNSIYSFTYQKIEPLPFKGLTDSLTTLRLGAASCNGKSRLFISLARLNNLPARLVGGIILDGDKKKTSHQWVEVFLESHWVPFDVTNGHFAYLPEHYLELYRGDHTLFRHTSNINFDYRFNSSQQQIAKAIYKDFDTDSSDMMPNVAKLIQDFGLPIKATYIFLLFPLCTLIITFLRNVIGLKTFGTFMPMLIAATCIYTGLLVGLLGFISVLALAYIGHHIMGRFHILKLPRLAIVITLITIASLVGISQVNYPIGLHTGILILFPAVIISFTADRISQLSDEHNWIELFQNTIGTFFSIILCFFTFNSTLLQGVFSIYPEFLIAVLATLLYIGSWSGMRISEVLRFRNLMNKEGRHIVGLNKRNISLINKYNDKKLLILATDKIETKKTLEEYDIPCPQTLATCMSHQNINDFMSVLESKTHIVIKPNKGSRGSGIIILSERKEDGFLNSSGKLLTNNLIKSHVQEILSGSFSQSGDEDAAFIEAMVVQHELLRDISPRGLCDIRLIVANGKLISAMLRIPTSQSNGKANLHQGAIGVGINLISGQTERALLKGREISHHPDTNKPLINIELPYWQDIKDIAVQCYIAIPLGYMGVDVCIDEDRGPLVLEVNGRPGLEIQNIQNSGMAATIQEAF